MAKKTPEAGTPKFPYTSEPAALRRMLAEIPKRPKPPKLNMDTVKAWGVSKNNNARTAITVLKKLGLLNESGEPNETYVEFMKTGIGPSVLAKRIREVYRPLFDNSHAPQGEPDTELKKLFHIHSGGGEDAMRLQTQTFKALSEYANFSDTESGGAIKGGAAGGSGSQSGSGRTTDLTLPPVQVDLHIHLPENKTSREYETIIQDIARYIYGRNIDRT
jgi:hypothetical protein